MQRRDFLRSIPLFGLAIIPGSSLWTTSQAAPAVGRKMRISLNWGAIGVQASQPEAIRLAQHHGFEAVTADAGYLSRLDDTQRQELVAELASHSLTWGAAGLPVEFRREQDRFREGMSTLPQTARALRQAGVSRVGTWLSPAHDTLSHAENFQLHSTRLRQVAQVLKDQDLRLGLEYVGTRSSRAGRAHSFIHSMAGMKELIEEIGTGNVGLILDSWHWWQAGDGIKDILTLRNVEVVAVDLNDAPPGIPMDQQRDNQRELPAATGVIDLKGFLQALNRIGYDGPVRAEPFNRALNELDNDAACAATIRAMRKAFSLLDPL